VHAAGCMLIVACAGSCSSAASWAWRSWRCCGSWGSTGVPPGGLPTTARHPKVPHDRVIGHERPPGPWRVRTTR